MRPESHSGPDSIKVTKVIFSLAKKTKTAAREDGRAERSTEGNRLGPAPLAAREGSRIDPHATGERIAFLGS
jgi:hypothetical protein